MIPGQTPTAAILEACVTPCIENPDKKCGKLGHRDCFESGGKWRDAHRFSSSSNSCPYSATSARVLFLACAAACIATARPGSGPGECFAFELNTAKCGDTTPTPHLDLGPRLHNAARDEWPFLALSWLHWSHV